MDESEMDPSLPLNDESLIHSKDDNMTFTKASSSQVSRH